jgi:hypothetical protein
MSAHRRDWGESAALLVCVGLFFALPNRYTIAGPKLTLALGIVASALCASTMLWTIFGSRRGARPIMAASAAVLTFILVTALAKLVYLVIYGASTIDGVRLLETALLIWVANVVLFAIIYHLIGEQEFLFPKGPEAAPALQFLDYVFLSYTTATAFSPTDTAPLTTRARMCMMLESTVSLMTIAIAAARAINILK